MLRLSRSEVKFDHSSFHRSEARNRLLICSLSLVVGFYIEEKKGAESLERNHEGPKTISILSMPQIE